MSHWFRKACGTWTFELPSFDFVSLLLELFPATSLQKESALFESSSNFKAFSSSRCLNCSLNDWFSFKESSSKTVAHADVVGNSWHFERKRVHWSLQTPKVKPGVIANDAKRTLIFAPWIQIYDVSPSDRLIAVSWTRPFIKQYRTCRKNRPN